MMKKKMETVDYLDGEERIDNYDFWHIRFYEDDEPYGDEEETEYKEI
jgi:hypothetical protein